MKPLILVTYATRAGSTVEIATAIGETLAQRGYVVDVKPVKENLSVDTYEAVVIGSAIRMSMWLPEAVEFVQANQYKLKEIPTAFFTVHMLNRGDDDASRQAREAYTAPVRAILTPEVEGFFDGMLDPARLSFLDRLITKFVQNQTASPIGDFRDWNKIRGWAQTIFA